jgi:hypothetical protein
MAQIHLINAEIKGRTYVASWYVEDERLYLSTVFTSDNVVLGKKDPNTEALKLLKRIIRSRGVPGGGVCAENDTVNAPALSHG